MYIKSIPLPEINWTSEDCLFNNIWCWLINDKNSEPAIKVFAYIFVRYGITQNKTFDYLKILINAYKIYLYKTKNNSIIK